MNKIHVFYHIATMKGYDIIFFEQMKEIYKSNLLDYADLSIGIVGDRENKITADGNIQYFGELTLYEYPTLHLLWEWCKQNKNAYVLYFHSKGVSSTFSDYKKIIWRYEMMGNIRNWKKCIKMLDKGFSMVSSGTKWLTNAGGERFWAGTFFWANSDYISKLPDPLLIPERFENSRWYAELWPSCHNIKFTICEIPKNIIEKISYRMKYSYLRNKNKLINKFNKVFLFAKGNLHEL